MQQVKNQPVHKTQLIADIITGLVCGRGCEGCGMSAAPSPGMPPTPPCKQRVNISKAASAIWRALTVDQDRLRILMAKHRGWDKNFEKYRDRIIHAIACDVPINIIRKAGPKHV